jgi:hypothetical protein
MFKFVFVLFITALLSACSVNQGSHRKVGLTIEVPGRGELVYAASHRPLAGNYTIDWSNDTFWIGRGLRVALEGLMTGILSGSGQGNASLHVLKSDLIQRPGCHSHLRVVLREVVHTGSGRITSDLLIPLQIPSIEGDINRGCVVTNEQLISSLSKALLQAAITQCLSGAEFQSKCVY